MKRKSGLFRDIYEQPYDDSVRLKLYNSSKGSCDLMQRMCLMKKLPVHSGCVNTISWNRTGEYILSGSDDQHIVLTNAYSYRVLTDHKTSHRANIFSAKFLPSTGDHHVISCSGDGIILFTDLTRKEETFYNQFNCHSGTTYEVMTIPGDSHSFLSCGEDGTVRWFDLRVKDRCNKPNCKEDVMISCKRAVTALSVNPVAPYQLAIGCSDSTVRIFDRRMLGTRASGSSVSEVSASFGPFCSFSVPEFNGRSYRITSLSFSPDGEEVLVSYSSDYLYLFSMKDKDSYITLKDSPMSGSSKSPSAWERAKKACGFHQSQSQQPNPPVKRLRLRGDWSDTGPDARPEREGGRRGEIAQARPTLHANLMQRMTDVLSRMLNDPATRAALSGGGEESYEGEEGEQAAQGNLPPGSEQSEGPSAADALPDPPQLDPAPSVTANLPLSSGEAAVGNVEVIAEAPEGLGSENPPPENSSDTSVLQSVPQISSLSLGSPATNRNHPENVDALNLSSSVSSQQFQSNEVDAQMPFNQTPPFGSEIMTQDINNLQDHLSSLREGFIERHHSEPAISLVYSEHGSTSGSISLGVGDEVGRELSSSQMESVPSQGMKETKHEPTSPESNPALAGCSGTGTAAREESYYDMDDDFNDSEDEDILDDSGPHASGSQRLIPPSEKQDNDSVAMDDEVIVQNGCKSQQFMCGDNCSYDPTIKQKYTGHRNARTMIKEATFWGDAFVLSGSDCGHVFVWERDTGKLVMLLEADAHVVNCLQPHPLLPLLATSGIDYDVKLWAPIAQESGFDSAYAEELTKRNEVMLEETRDTITVPASFMIRMLACLNQIRRGARSRVRNPRRQNPM
ncbi:DDB1- and CUL4-associated factor 6-like isoform X2 [Ischnura elegans]|uniref:DDB1- and CUL4-associated factor 6-like isoform X2 n=1 Tax=Ischnura elegans TaxID=197161 RepID=UPI001ED8AFCE|nr:DDB1- and CUL4-associated factor 6-like isoform X2 [Ischnura elegans]